MFCLLQYLVVTLIVLLYCLYYPGGAHGWWWPQYFSPRLCEFLLLRLGLAVLYLRYPLPLCADEYGRLQGALRSTEILHIRGLT